MLNIFIATGIINVSFEILMFQFSFLIPFPQLRGSKSPISLDGNEATIFFHTNVFENQIAGIFLFLCCTFIVGKFFV